MKKERFYQEEAAAEIWNMALVAFTCLMGVIVTVTILFQVIGLS